MPIPLWLASVSKVNVPDGIEKANTGAVVNRRFSFSNASLHSGEQTNTASFSVSLCNGPVTSAEDLMNLR